MDNYEQIYKKKKNVNKMVYTRIKCLYLEELIKPLYQEVTVTGKMRRVAFNNPA